METALDRIFLDFSVQKLEQLYSRIENCLGKLNQQQIWMRASENENAVGNLVLHLSGNVRQWIVSAIGGQPDIRVRDREFSARGDIQASEMLQRLKDTVQEASVVLGKLSPERLAQRVTVQNYDLAVMEAIFHVVEHFAQHTGQIIFITKMLSGADMGFYRHLKAAAHSEKNP